MKAYSVQAATRGDEYGEVVFAETAGKAKAAAICELDCEWLDIISCRRAPQYDQFYPGPVPRKQLLKDGWTWECGGCQRRVWEDADVAWVGEEPCCNEACAQRCRNLLARAINHATPEQQAEAMTRLTPEQEDIARRFEDAGK